MDLLVFGGSEVVAIETTRPIPPKGRLRWSGEAQYPM